MSDTWQELKTWMIRCHKCHQLVIEQDVKEPQLPYNWERLMTYSGSGYQEPSYAPFCGRCKKDHKPS